jgi:hypothetical protein
MVFARTRAEESIIMTVEVIVQLKMIDRANPSCCSHDFAP